MADRAGIRPQSPTVQESRPKTPNHNSIAHVQVVSHRSAQTLCTCICTASMVWLDVHIMAYRTLFNTLL